MKQWNWLLKSHVVFHVTEAVTEWPTYFVDDGVIFSWLSSKCPQYAESHRYILHIPGRLISNVLKKVALDIRQGTVLKLGCWRAEKPLCVNITKCYTGSWTARVVVEMMIHVRVAQKKENFLDNWSLRQRVPREVQPNKSVEVLGNFGVSIICRAKSLCI
jgi:hypothetical protein